MIHSEDHLRRLRRGCGSYVVTVAASSSQVQPLTSGMTATLTRFGSSSSCEAFTPHTLIQRWKLRRRILWEVATRRHKALPCVPCDLVSTTNVC